MDVQSGESEEEEVMTEGIGGSEMEELVPECIIILYCEWKNPVTLWQNVINTALMAIFIANCL